MSSKRQVIVDAIVARLKLINGTGDFTNNIASQVEDWRVNWDENELPAISVCDLTAEGTPTSSGQSYGTVHELPIQIRIYAVKGTAAAEIRTWIKDVMTAIRQDDKFSVANVPSVMQTRQIRDGFIIPEDSFEVIGAVVEISVQYITRKFNAEA